MFTMAQRYRSRRQARKFARKSRRNFIISLFLIGLLGYLSFAWILPTLINGIGLVKNNFSPSKKVVSDTSYNSSLAPPVLNIPYEATNTAQINIRGYGAPNSKMAIFLDDDKKDSVEVTDDGTFELKNIQLGLGINNIYGKSIDDKNQESLPSKTFKIIYDNEAPPLNISEPEDGKIIQGGDKRVKISGNTEVNTQVFINDSQVIVDKNGNFSSEQTLNEGDNNFNIKAVDSVSNFTEAVRRVNLRL